MTITKLGHCCMLIEEGNLTILTDPGTYSESQNNINGIDVVLITHDHSDHLHVDSLKVVLGNNPNAKVYTNAAVGEKLEKEGIASQLLEEGQSVTEKEVAIEAFGKLHAVMHPEIPQSPNTGYFIANRFFYPGDAFTNPRKPIEILALPVAGPWINLQQAIEYAKELHPKTCFPVHDGLLKNIGSTNVLPPKILEPLGIHFIVPELGKEMEY